MKNIVLLFIFISAYSYSQNVQTKFNKKGVLIIKNSERKYNFKKNAKVFLIKRLGEIYWEVNTNGYTGFVSSEYLKLTDEILATIKQYEEKSQKLKAEKENANKKKEDAKKKKEADRIAKEIKEHIINDSIINVKRIEEKELKKRELIKRHRIDSLKYSKYLKGKPFNQKLLVTVVRPNKLMLRPNSESKNISTEKYTDVYILNFANNYFEVIYEDKIYYVDKDYVLKSKYVKGYMKKIQSKKIRQKYGSAIANSIERGEYWIGMTVEMAILSLGPGFSNNRSVGSWGVHNQLVYRSKGLYLYFENGILKSWQD